MTRHEMITALGTEQNRIALAGVPIDIMSWAGMCDDAELAAHLARYQAYVPEAKPVRNARKTGQRVAA